MGLTELGLVEGLLVKLVLINVLDLLAFLLLVLLDPVLGHLPLELDLDNFSNRVIRNIVGSFLQDFGKITLSHFHVFLQ